MGAKFINVYDLGPEGLEIDQPVAALPSAEDTAPDVGLLFARLRGRAERGKRGVDLRALLEARVELECCRCLEPYESEISTEFFLILVPDGVEFGAGETEVSAESAALFFAPEGKAELDRIVAEQIYLNLPLKPVCDADCRGLCPTCGANRNRIECGCREEELDPRLAPLLEFKKRKGGS